MKIKHAISSSGGNDSVAMIQWAIERQLPETHVVFCDTGWAAPGWMLRVEKVHRYAEKQGINTHIVKSIGMEELVRIKKGFPGNAQQFCTAHLKGVPFLEWIDELDPNCQARVLVGKRRAESEARKDTQEFVKDSPYHGGRTLWHPLYLHTDAQRNELLRRAGFEPLPHRSLECNPCVNANRGDLLRLTPGEIERVNDLEVEIGQPMFRPKRFGAMGIHGVIVWAKEGRERGDILIEEGQCAGLFGCGI
jgi:3'-phosphoadenosine 5'-phosphosulfate sulfotransferase (PAPS reductase)/FAD synthetase